MALEIHTMLCSAESYDSRDLFFVLFLSPRYQILGINRVWRNTSPYQPFADIFLLVEIIYLGLKFQKIPKYKFAGLPTLYSSPYLS